MHGFVLNSYATGQNSLSTRKSKKKTWLSKKFQTHPPKPAEAEPSFGKVSLHTVKVCMLLSTPSDKLWIEAYCPKFKLACCRETENPHRKCSLLYSTRLILPIAGCYKVHAQ